MRRKITKVRVTKLTKNLKFMVGGSWLDVHKKSELQKWSKKKLITYTMLIERVLWKIIKDKAPRLKTIKRKPIESLGNGYGRQVFQAKYLPKRKKRKFSRKQLAAQRLFAKRARAGTLRRRR